VFKARLLGGMAYDIDRYDVRDIHKGIVEREEQQRVHDELLASLGALRTFSVGAAVATGPTGSLTPGRRRRS